MKLALYQTYPGQVLRSYNISTIGKEGTQINLFAPTKFGLQQAIDLAERADATIVRLDEEYFTSDDLLFAVRKLVAAGKGTKVFMPAIGLERELTNAK